MPRDELRCRAIVKSGRRKGERCEYQRESSGYCRRHWLAIEKSAEDVLAKFDRAQRRARDRPGYPTRNNDPNRLLPVILHWIGGVAGAGYIIEKIHENLPAILESVLTLQRVGQDTGLIKLQFFRDTATEEVWEFRRWQRLDWEIVMGLPAIDNPSSDLKDLEAPQYQIELLLAELILTYQVAGLMIDELRYESDKRVKAQEFVDSIADTLTAISLTLEVVRRMSSSNLQQLHPPH